MIANLPRWVWILVVGGLLILPSLGTYGLWDPAEIREADVAREVAEKGSFGDVTVDGQYANRPVLTVWLVAAGFKLLGVNELAGRFPLALCGLLALLLAYRIGRRLVSEGAGLLAAFVLGTTPTFLGQCRQLVSEVPYYASLLAAAGGLLAFLWPADGKRSRLDLVIGAVGLVAGFLARGALLGVALPLVALGIAVAMTLRSQHRGIGDAWPAASGPDVKIDDSLQDALRSALKPLLVALAAAGVVIGIFAFTLPNTEFLVLGGELKRLSIPPQVHVTFRELGFGMYPWFALLPVALMTFLWVSRRSQDATTETAGEDPLTAAPVPPDAPGSPEAPGRGASQAAEPCRQGEVPPGAPAAPLPPARDALIKYLVVALAILGYGAATVWAGYLGKLRFPALPWLAVGVGVLLHEAWRTHARHRLWGLVAASVILVLQQDYVMAPESLAFSHLLQKGKYPADLDIKTAMRLFGVALAVLMFFGLGGAPKAFAPTRLTSRVSRDRLRQRPVVGWLVAVPGLSWLIYGLVFVCAWLIDQLSWVGVQLGIAWRWLAGIHDRRIWLATGALTLGFAAWCTHYLTPQLSNHLSNKALFGRYHDCKSQGERLAQYLVSGRGAAYYNDGQVDKVRTQADLFKLLRQPARTFVLIPASHLGAIDKAARQAKVSYHVLDDSNSQYLIISNKLAGACAEDVNPLRKLVLRTAPSPKKRVLVNFENRVHLIGYDVDDAVSRGGKFKITMYYKVLKSMPANQKIFIHFDQPAHRFHGDHKPLDGKYPTQYWLPGDYIVDPKKVEIPMLTTPTGRYNIMTGFWLGSRRLKIVEGPNDGSDRAKIGTIRVKAF